MAADPNTNTGLTSSSDFVQIYIIDIDIKGANNLVKADFMGKSDPYCKISALGRSYQTQTIEQTLDPEWNEHTQFCFFDDPGSLKFEVVDFDASFNNDPIGDVDFSLAGFFEEGHAGFDGSVALQNVNSGTLNLNIQCKCLVPDELEDKCTNLQAQLEEQRRTVIQKTSRNENVKGQNAQQTAANITAQDQLQSVKTENEKIQEQIGKLNEEIAALQDENKQMEDNIPNLQSDLRDAEAKRDELQAEIDEARRMCEELETKNQGLTQQVSDVDARIREAEQARIAQEQAESQRLLDKAKEEENTGPKVVAAVDDDDEPAGGSSKAATTQSKPPEENEPQGCRCIIV